MAAFCFAINTLLSPTNLQISKRVIWKDYWCRTLLTPSCPDSHPPHSGLFLPRAHPFAAAASVPDLILYSTKSLQLQPPCEKNPPNNSGGYFQPAQKKTASRSEIRRTFLREGVLHSAERGKYTMDSPHPIWLSLGISLVLTSSR